MRKREGKREIEGVRGGERERQRREGKISEERREVSGFKLNLRGLSSGKILCVIFEA